MGLGFAAFGAELPELEARCHERLTCAQPSVLAATEDPQGTRVFNLFARDWESRDVFEAPSLCCSGARNKAAATWRGTPKKWS